MKESIRTIEQFNYPELPWKDDFSGMGERFADLFPGQGGKPERLQAGPAGVGEPEPPNGATRLGEADVAARVAAECRLAEERGLRKGMEAGLAQGRDEAAHRFATERDRLLAQTAALAETFSESQEKYFKQLEHESVQLALSIAARILRRETQMDPLLLTGAVRVALGQLADSTSVRLVVPERDREMWEQALSLIPRLRPRPLVKGDERMQAGECRMETELGSVDLGLWSQLKEIERGFFDRFDGSSQGKREANSENDPAMRRRRDWSSAEFETEAFSGFESTFAGSGPESLLGDEAETLR